MPALLTRARVATGVKSVSDVTVRVTFALTAFRASAVLMTMRITLYNVHRSRFTAAVNGTYSLLCRQTYPFIPHCVLFPLSVAMLLGDHRYLPPSITMAADARPQAVRMLASR